MPSPSTKVAARLAGGIKQFQPVLTAAKARDINESETVTIVKDMLGDVFGFDKYADVTSEYAIRGTYVDLALKVDGKLHLLIEVKAIGQNLEDRHTKQAVDYGANQGIEWVVLTNGVQWQTYRITFGKPIQQELVMETDFLALSPRNSSHVDGLFPLTKEGIVKSALHAHHEQRQATNRFVLGAIIQSDTVLELVRREVRRLSPNVRIDVIGLRDLIAQEVLKRDVVEGDKAVEARAKVRRAAARRLRITSPTDAPQKAVPPEEDTPPA
jgi:hypothetical protein